MEIYVTDGKGSSDLCVCLYVYVGPLHQISDGHIRIGKSERQFPGTHTVHTYIYINKNHRKILETKSLKLFPGMNKNFQDIFGISVYKK